MPPFRIMPDRTEITADPAELRAAFAALPVQVFEDVFDPELLALLLRQAEQTQFVHDEVDRLGTREVEAPQRVGAALGLMLGRHALFEWLEAVTGTAPLRAISGRLVQTRTRPEDELTWHDDLNDKRRQLAVVLNLSTAAFAGGAFDLRRKGEIEPLFSYHHQRPGTLMVFGIGPELEHRVTPLRSGGPRRVYAGWVMSEPVSTDDPLARRP
jgi:hypothetical protein